MQTTVGTDRPKARPVKRWISRNAMARLLDTTPANVIRLAEQKLIGVRELPGIDPKYDRLDVERLLAESTKPSE